MLGLSVIILFKSVLHVFCSLVFSAHNTCVKYDSGWISNARGLCLFSVEKRGRGLRKFLFFSMDGNVQVLLVSSLGGNGWIIPGGKVVSDNL